MEKMISGEREREIGDAVAVQIALHQLAVAEVWQNAVSSDAWT